MTTWAQPRQLALLDDPIETRAREFDHTNPWIYAHLVRLARARRNAGYHHGSINQLFEVLRWERDLLVHTDDGIKVNNSYRAYYARKIMANCPDLSGFFHTRVTRQDKEHAA